MCPECVLCFGLCDEFSKARFLPVLWTKCGLLSRIVLSHFCTTVWLVWIFLLNNPPYTHITCLVHLERMDLSGARGSNCGNIEQSNTLSRFAILSGGGGSRVSGRSMRAKKHRVMLVSGVSLSLLNCRRTTERNPTHTEYT